jgi:hypothetical protein
VEMPIGRAIQCIHDDFGISRIVLNQ